MSKPNVIQADPVSSKFLNEMREADRVWFEQNPHHVERIRREVEGDYRLPSGERMDQADCVMVVEIAEGVRFRSGVTIVPFSPLWQVLHIGRDYDDDDFIPEVKDMFQSFPKPQGAWKAFKKHRAAKARRQ